ncbi:RNA polymerase sigma factor [Ensifer canadensis]
MTTETQSETRVDIFLAHRPALIAYAVRLLGSRDAAEDIVQDAFVRFLPSSTRSVSKGQLLAYLYRTVRNLSLDVLRRRKVAAIGHQDDVPFWSVPADMPTPEQSTLLCDDVRRISQILSELPVEARVAVEMHRFGGYTLEEVASHLGISTASAHRYVTAAMMKIATALLVNAT